MSELTSVAVYRRQIGASLERVWENVRDWEHLPWLHRESFASVALEQEGEFGWRVRVGLRSATEPAIRLELVAESERRYVARTLEGPGAATEIWTRLDPIDARRTDIEVEFLVPDVAACDGCGGSGRTSSPAPCSASRPARRRGARSGSWRSKAPRSRSSAPASRRAPRSRSPCGRCAARSAAALSRAPP
jgi:hypothetical protein